MLFSRLIDAMPDTIATTMPMRYAGTFASSTPSLKASIRLIILAPRTAGTDSRNENFTANFLSSPVAIPAVMVVPERERPGIVATHWHRPIISASEIVMLAAFFVPGFILSATNSIQPVSTRATPMNTLR